MRDHRVATVADYVNVGMTDFLLVLRGDRPPEVGEALVAQLARLRELG